jgi:phosphatidylglycerol---prolipoprotein diacylglyceryl transferase
MYPNLAYLFNDIFNDSLPIWLTNILQVFNIFGLMLAMAFLAAVYFLKIGLQQKASEGKLQAIYKTQIVGKPAQASEYILNGLLGFIVGYKLGLLITDFTNFTADVQAAIFSKQGNFITGLIVAAVFLYWLFAEKKKTQLAEPKEEKTLLHPKDWVGEIFIRAAIGGIVGAKLFHLFEYWSDFTADPLGMLFSGAGLTFYGGLLVGSGAVIYWVIKNKISLKVMIDVTAPCLMIAYAIGRIGCQLAGDGDWGIFNTAYAVNDNQKIVVAASATDYHQTFAQHNMYFINHFNDTSKAEIAYFKGPDFLPNWLFAYNYPHNVGNEGIAIKNCTGKYCGALPLPVFPTPLYEVIMCLALFGVLWLLRNKLKHNGQLMAIYMVLNGVERFTIEQIRVNSTYQFLGINPTQAEIIALLLILGGIVLWFAVQQKQTQKIL